MTRQPACMWNWRRPSRSSSATFSSKQFLFVWTTLKAKFARVSVKYQFEYFLRYPWIFLKMLSRFGLCKKGRMAGKEKQIGRPRKIFCQHWYWAARQCNSRKYKFNIKRTSGDWEVFPYTTLCFRNLIDETLAREYSFTKVVDFVVDPELFFL